MNFDYRERFLALGQLVLFAAIFAFDAFLPLGVAAGVPYLAPVLLSYYSRTQTAALVTAIIGTALTLGGYLLSAQGGAFWMVVTNRIIALFAIWTTAILIMNHHAKRKALKRNLHIIDQNVKVAEISPAGTITSISNNLCRYLGITREEMIGEPSDFLYESTPKNPA